ncbi:MAG: hypothetical protein K2L11_10260 [Muribaculaceae bacterium]|nr:hypothetical protein [Muribaculaceae bacterium]
MKLKYILSIILSAVFSITSFADDKDNISLGYYISDEGTSIPTETASLLEGKMKKIITASGYADNLATGRFALVARCDILQKDVVPSTPPRISQKIEISFAVVDIIENKVYGCCNMTVSGIGTNETKAFSTAFQKVSVQNQELSNMLSKSKQKILDYYTYSCSQIETEATTYASIGQYDKAIFSLMSVPSVCTDCHERCQALVAKIYQQKINSECTSILERAKSIWATSPTESSAIEIGNMLRNIDPQAAGYNDVVKFRNQIASKLSADARREWDFKLKKYNDNQQFKRSIVDACSSVGETFAKNFRLPQINFFKRH